MQQNSQQQMMQGPPAMQQSQQSNQNQQHQMQWIPACYSAEKPVQASDVANGWQPNDFQQVAMMQQQWVMTPQGAAQVCFFPAPAQHCQTPQTSPQSNSQSDTSKQVSPSQSNSFCSQPQIMSSSCDASANMQVQSQQMQQMQRNAGSCGGAGWCVQNCALPANGYGHVPMQQQPQVPQQQVQQSQFPQQQNEATWTNPQFAHTAQPQQLMQQYNQQSPNAALQPTIPWNSQQQSEPSGNKNTETNLYHQQQGSSVNRPGWNGESQASTRTQNAALDTDNWRNPANREARNNNGPCGSRAFAQSNHGARIFPTMAELAQDSSAGGCQQTVEESEVAILDCRGVPTESQKFSTFEEVPFAPSIIQDLVGSGFPSPSQIQQYTWPLTHQGRDVVGVAATGSGKTLAFLLPAFSYIVERGIKAGSPTFLVMAPTRELAVQIEAEASKFGWNSGIWTACLYGGSPKGKQAHEIRQGVHGIIGTPGRINDFLETGQLRLGEVCKLVLDEADRMLDMGFEPQIRKILDRLPQDRHTLFFTATWPRNVRKLASEFLRDPLRVQIGNRDELKGNQDITQILKLVSHHSQKSEILMDVLREAGVTDRTNSAAKAILFCPTKAMCDELATVLRDSGVLCVAIHGDKEQWERERALNNLKMSKIKLLVATDVAARGLDIKGITLIVNYTLPTNTEDYVHRIGRTGRAGQKGYAVSLVSKRDSDVLPGVIDVMRRTNQEVPSEIEQLCRRPGYGRGGHNGGYRGNYGNGNSRQGFGQRSGSSYRNGGGFNHFRNGGGKGHGRGSN